MCISPTTIEVRLYGTTPLHQPATLAKLLEVMETADGFTPEYWSTDERKKYPYKREDVLDVVEKPRDLYPSVYLWRGKVAKYMARFDIGLFPEFTCILDPKLARKNWPGLLHFCDRMAAVFEPDVSLLELTAAEPPSPWQDDLSRRRGVMLYSAMTLMKDYRMTGLQGLSTRTYFGPHYIDLIGRDVLLSTPEVVIEELDWGGVRIDLSDDLTTLTEDVMLERWERAMAHLQPSGVFAVPAIYKDRFVKFSKCPKGVIARRIKIGRAANPPGVDEMSDDVVTPQPQDKIYAKYDDASWHPEGGDGDKEGLLEGSSRTHIGLYLAWAINNHLVSEYHLSKNSEAIAQVKARKLRGSDFLHKYCGDKLTCQDFNEDGNAFTEGFYKEEYLGGEYPFAADPASMLPSLYHVPDTWETYAAIEEMLNGYYGSRE